MDCKVRWIAALVVASFMATPSSGEESAFKPFFVPRPDFYDSSAQEGAVAEPNLFRLVGRDFKNLVTTKENWMILGAGLGAAWGASHFDDAIVGSAFNSELNRGTSLDRVFESGAFAGDGYVQVGTAVAAYGIGKIFPRGAWRTSDEICCGRRLSPEH